ncbi:hypothetical protein BGZ98_003601 [Dissophora globulifera]|nr:hypothetical protein BGZ98_003601 [Dissophora globulifera]
MAATEPIKIVVVGGSHGGVTVIKHLLTSIQSSNKKVEITLVEKRDARHHNYGAYRALVNAEFGDKVWVPYTTLFGAKSGHKVVQGSLAHVHHHDIVLESGTSIPFDYLVLATGSSNPSPSKFNNVLASADAVAATNQTRADLIKSKNVVIIGGGACGCELAGEIKTAFPDKTVTIVHSGANLVDYEGFASSFKSAAKKHLEGLGVAVVLNERANIEGLSSENSIRVGSATITTKDGKKIESDMQFFTIGNQVDTSYISSLKPEGVEEFDASTLVDQERHVLKIRKTMQLSNEAFPHIFAVGDCTDFSKVAVGVACTYTAPTVAKNIFQLISSGPKAKLANGSVPGGLMILSTGPTTGITALPLFGSKFGNFFSKALKSKDLLLGTTLTDMKVASK